MRRPKPTPLNTRPDTAAFCFYSLSEAASQAIVCTRCELSQTRTHAVFADGNPQAPLMLIGEGPGQTEDETGLPFVGKAGQLLNQLLASAHIRRPEDVYICNVVKCHPPGNRAPLPEEAAACAPYLLTQIALVRPKIILLAGTTALKSVLGVSEGITKVRGQWLETPFEGVQAMAIFHPSYLLRFPANAPGSPLALTTQDLHAVRHTLDGL
jgi:uracil-DNA glycosylase family 4